MKKKLIIVLAVIAVVLLRGGVYWKIPIGASALLEVVDIRRMKCPNKQCRKWVCDIWETRFGVVVIELKCQHCGEVVRIYWKRKEKK